MCLLCIEVAKGKITSREVGRALGEFTVAKDHIDEFFQALEQRFTPDELVEIVSEELRQRTVRVSNGSKDE